MFFQTLYMPAASLLAAAALAQIDSKPEKSPAQIARSAFPSVVLIATQDERGQPLLLGSGFFVEKDIVATNFHVIDGAATGYAKVIEQSSKLNIKGVLALDAIHDLVLLQLDDSRSPSSSIAPKVSINIGDPVYAIGNPRGLEGTFSQGIISSVRELGADHILQITAPISPGSSGGPVLDQTGVVVGVSVASIANGQNLNFAIPSDYLVALQKTKSELRPLNAAAQTKGQKSTFDQIGNHKTHSGVIGTNLTYDRGPTGFFSCSLQNELREPIKEVKGAIVFYSEQGDPIEVAQIEYAGVIPAGLAKRITGRVDASVQELNCPRPWREFPLKPKGKVEIRIFDFVVANE